MARPHSPPILDQLRNAHSLPEQHESLQALKNEIVGHKLKKEAWLALGVLDHIVACLSLHRSPAKAVPRDAGPQQSSQRPLSDEDTVRLQALQIITSFAHGGPAFLQPIHAAGALPAILTCISPTANPTQIVVAALKTLISIANASALALSPHPLDIPSLADCVFSPPHLESFCHMLTTISARHPFSQSPSSLASSLICRLCREERHQHALATSGVLDVLATQLASFAVAQGCVVPGAEEEAYSCQLFDLFPEPAHPDAKIGPVLEAIAVILGDSRYRSARLVNSPAILIVFPSIRFHPLEGSVAVRKAKGRVTAMEYLLPKVSSTLAFTSSRTYRSDLAPGRRDLDSPRKNPADQHRHAPPTMADIQPGMCSASDDEEIECPLIPWLILQFRSLSGYERLMAADVLTCLYRAGFGRPVVREVTLGVLVVPGIIDLIKTASKDPTGASDSIEPTKCLILERAPVILAHLIADSDYLQKAAFECLAVKTLTALLRRAYEPVAPLDQPKAWTPHPNKGKTDTLQEGPASSSRLGSGGQNPVLLHRLRLREAALKAIGTLASGEDDYRKAFAEQNFLPYVVASLLEHPSKPRELRDRSKDKPSDGEASASASASSSSSASASAPAPAPASGYGTNPSSVIIAGCHAVRMLARSISNLRTLLVDHEVAMPVLGFMKHPDVNVQIAATAAICNLVVEVSPVRELLIENGVMQVLCEHAHSENAALRLNALWALKHLVVAASPELKKSCLAQVEPEWLLQLLSGDDAGARSGAVAGDDVDEDMEAAPPAVEAFRWPYVTNGVLRELDASRSSKLRQVEEALASIHDAEVDPVRRARLDDIAVQEQALDLIRNLISPGPGSTAELPSETTDMIDHLFGVLGQERFFDVMTSKLHARVLNPYYRRGPGAGRDTIVVHPQAKVIASVIWILVHVAASSSRHRELIVWQTGLLKQLALQASSKDREVRVALCHLVINLTGQEEESEVSACARRAMELRKLGFQGRLEKLHELDQDLNVRERAKTAVWQMKRASSY
ncbi:Uncharacterized protein ESCO_001755 [Escovopsis weberi]|uniref:Uncharacterized protein n=1 Tax=Escovopsis weberi TaxID=150374 RepID=A0A0M8N310_ESCWE|nr:Uncharacterized protein ESCO_001755 [Escovopsis weberi]